MNSTIVFDDGLAYERFMGRWSRAVGASFLDWLAPPAQAHWLDVGCGTGVFTELVLDACAPAAMSAVDPAPAQIGYARGRPAARCADFRVADALSLPFADGSFDIVASALVLNFISDRARALAEMRRVVRSGGMVAGYVWDFAADRSPTAPLALGVRAIGRDPPSVPGTEASSLDALTAMFARAGFDQIASRPIDARIDFANFDEFWQAQMPSFSPFTKLIASLADAERVRLIDAVRAAMRAGPGGQIAYSARANAIKARAPA